MGHAKKIISMGRHADAMRSVSRGKSATPTKEEMYTFKLPRRPLSHPKRIYSFTHLKCCTASPNNGLNLLHPVQKGNSLVPGNSGFSGLITANIIA
jgi:hypothetical protein